MLGAWQPSSAAPEARSAPPGATGPGAGALVRATTTAATNPASGAGAGAATDVHPTGAPRTASDRRPTRWRSHCDKCKTFVPQGQDAALCDAPGCQYLLCFRCFPDPSQELWCTQHQGGVHLRTQRGVVAVAPAVETQAIPALPAGAAPVLTVMFTAIAVLLAAVAPTSVAGLERSWRFFTTFLRFVDVPIENVTEWVICAYVLCRVCPPVGIELPQFMARHVMPATAYGDILALRRRARMSGYRELLDALLGDRVAELCRRLTAGVKRKKTTKSPILIHHLRDLWNGTANRTAGFVRDVTLMLVALLIGLRRREIVALTVGDVVWNGRELRVTVRRDKVNFNLVGAECPRTVVASHELLDLIWPIFAARFLPAGTPADRPLFRVCAGVHITNDGLSPNTIRTIIRERLPGLPVSPHSLRVGCATELHAAGVSLDTIMEIGRWSSLAALIYVLPSADKMARATRSMGSGGVTFDRVVVQRELHTDPKAPRVRRLA